MTMNPYLVRQKKQHDELRAAITALTEKAAAEDRDLTEDELRSVTENTAKATALGEQITALVKEETRSRKVGELAATVEAGDEEIRPDSDNEDGETRSAERPAGTARTRDRDPGHYRSVEQGGQHSFFADQFRSRTLGDEKAIKRLDEHMRAVTVASGGAGVVPPKWLTDEYQAIARQTRVVANAVRPLPLGDDPRPIVLPKQTAGTDANVLPQAAEGANTAGWGTDRYTSNTDTLTPIAYAVYQDVSRQLLDSSSPAADMLIFGDMRSAWDAKVESLTCAAILAGGTAAGATFADEAAFSTGAVAVDAVIDAQTAVAGDQRGAADLAIMNFRRFGAYRKLKDSTNRPLMPVSRYSPQNADGALGNIMVGDIEGVDVLGSAGVPTAYAEKYAVLRRTAVILAESATLQFTYDQVVGPSAVRMGLWGYVGTLVRNPNSVAVLTVTAA